MGKIASIMAGAAAFAVLAGGTPAQASVTDLVQMTFLSGATFSGDVTFADDYSYVLDVTGTLTGYVNGTNGYVGSGSDSINWVWANGVNYSSGTDNYSDFLMDGPGSGYTSTTGYSNWILFAYNYSAAPVLAFTSGVSCCGDNEVDYTDPLVSGSISPASGATSAVPEASTWAMMGLGFAGLGLAGFRARHATVAV